MPMDYPKPAYLDGTFLELGDGFHFSLRPPDAISDDRYLRSNDPWEVLACVLARAQAGVFESLGMLVDLMHSHDRFTVWSACAKLIGFAGSRQLQQDALSEFSDQIQDPGVLLHVSYALAGGCGLWSIPHLRAMHRAAVDDDDMRIHLQICMSHLLEPEQGGVWFGPEEELIVDSDLPPEFAETSIVRDQLGYEALIDAHVAALRPIFDQDGGHAILGGARFEVEALARKLLSRISSGLEQQTVEWERLALEATTGLSCGGFFDSQGRLLRLAAAAILEDFLDSGQAAAYEPGVRYFFGHRIPDDAAVGD